MDTILGCRFQKYHLARLIHPPHRTHPGNLVHLTHRYFAPRKGGHTFLYVSYILL